MNDRRDKNDLPTWLDDRSEVAQLSFTSTYVREIYCLSSTGDQNNFWNISDIDCQKGWFKNININKSCKPRQTLLVFAESDTFRICFEFHRRNFPNLSFAWGHLKWPNRRRSSSPKRSWFNRSSRTGEKAQETVRNYNNLRVHSLSLRFMDHKLWKLCLKLTVICCYQADSNDFTIV